jgi:hypothetical protein
MKKLPQLTLRDLFWLVALVAMGCGWAVDRFRIAEQWEALEREKYLTKSEHDLLIQGATTNLNQLLAKRDYWDRIKARLDDATRQRLEDAEVEELQLVRETVH